MPEDPPRPDLIEFRIHPADDGNEVPVDLLTQGLSGLQQLIYLFALQSEGRTVRQRARLSEDLRERYVLRCSPPKQGSFSVPWRVGDYQDAVWARGQIAEVMGSMKAFSRATVASNSEDLLKLVPDERLRVRMLSCLNSMAPPPGSGYRYEFRNGVGDAIPLSEDLPTRISKLLERPAEQGQKGTITGEVQEITFNERKLAIHYLPQHRSLECFYDEALEPMLFENRRGLIQVTGQIIMDEDNHPKKIVEVDQIQELDLSPFALVELRNNSFALRLKEPLKLVPQLSESQQLISIIHDPLDIDVFAPTRAELFGELSEQIIMLWREYALENDANLSDPARELKRLLLMSFVSEEQN